MEREKNYEKLYIDSSENILTALKQMDVLENKLLIVIKDNKFFSLLSIGDIQRALINNSPMEAMIENILRKEISVAYDDEDIDMVKKKMFEERVECMPILDRDGNILDVLIWDDIFKKERMHKKRDLNLPVVIMAGGKGTRLKPLTNVIPKPLIPYEDKTITEYIIDKFMAAGCKEFILSTNYKAEFIRFYFDQVEEKDYELSFITEPEPLGTIGSLYLLKDIIKSSFFVTNCDILIDQDLNEIYDFHRKNNNEITIISAIKQINIPYGTLTVENGQLIDIQEKPDIVYNINTGLYIFEPHILNEIPSNEYTDINHLFSSITNRNGKIGVFPINEGSWKDIGEWTHYKKILFAT